MSQSTPSSSEFFQDAPPKLPMSALAEDIGRYAQYEERDPANLALLSRIWNSTQPRHHLPLFPRGVKRRSIFQNARLEAREWSQVQHDLDEKRSLPGLPFPKLEEQFFRSFFLQTIRCKFALLLAQAKEPELQVLAESLWLEAEEIFVPGGKPLSWQDAREQYAVDPRTVWQQLRVIETRRKLQFLNEYTEADYSLDSFDRFLVKREPSSPIQEVAFNVQLRHLIRRDLPEVVEIERQSFEFPWTEQDFLENLRVSNTSAMVAEWDNRILGYIVYENHEKFRRILNEAVHPEFRKSGISILLLKNLMERETPKKRRFLELIVSLKNTEAHEYFWHRDFLLDDLLLNPYTEAKMPAMKMRYDMPGFSKEQSVAMEEKDVVREVFPHIQKLSSNILLQITKADKTGAVDALEDMMHSMRGSSFAWQQGMRCMRSVLLADQQARSSLLLREGWKTVARTREATKEEWSQFKQCGDSVLLGRHFGKKKKSHFRDLSEVIDTKRHRAELEQLYALGDCMNIEATDAKERAILAEAFSAVMFYLYAEFAKGRHIAGTPQYLFEHREITCFTGPWLVASMLLECGIPVDRLFFCQVLGDPHAALMVRTLNRHITVVDVGARRMGQPLRPSLLAVDQDRRKFIGLLEGKHTHPTSVQLNEGLAHTLDLPHRMQVMPAFKGFASGSLLHTGIAFEIQKKYEEARRAFELGLTYNPICPHLHHQLGRMHFRFGNTDLAERYLWGALRLDEHNLTPHFTLGELRLSQGDPEEALRHFEICARADDAFFMENELKEQSDQYLSLQPDELLDSWKINQQRSGSLTEK